MYICRAALEETLPPLDQLRYLLPVHLEPALLVAFEGGEAGGSFQLVKPHALLLLADRLP